MDRFVHDVALGVGAAREDFQGVARAPSALGLAPNGRRANEDLAFPVLVAGRPYFVERLSGEVEGHRFDRFALLSLRDGPVRDLDQPHLGLLLDGDWSPRAEVAARRERHRQGVGLTQLGNLDPRG